MLLHQDVRVTVHVLDFFDVGNFQRKIMLRKTLVAHLKYLREISITQLFDDFEIIIINRLRVAVFVQELAGARVRRTYFLVLRPILPLAFSRAVDDGFAFRALFSAGFATNGAVHLIDFQ